MSSSAEQVETSSVDPSSIAASTIAAMTTRTLYVDAGWISPWACHALVALEEKQLPYTVETVPLPIPAATRAALATRSLTGKVPVLVDGAVAIGESLAISEYLAESYPFPAHPRLFPADLGQRARAREAMLWLRTELFALREERPTATVFGAPTTTPLSAGARADADELIRIASRLVTPGATSLFADWCIADVDLAIALMRLIRNRDAVPAHLVAYAEAQWQRPSLRAFVDRRR
jgi:glutathione S-transferase